MDADDHDFSGRHIYADIYGLSSEEAANAKWLQAGLEAAIEQCGAQICGHVTKSFEPTGFTCLYLLAESHASIHTYPERGAIFFDAFTCGAPDPGVIMEQFVKMFRHARVVHGRLERGERRRIEPDRAPSLREIAGTDA
jgi:S-adenosylmethionine decarboxylase proenzyme